ncbi:MAG: hypothetical protein ACYDAI_18145 [Trichloromonadaceae bacterium]
MKTMIAVTFLLISGCSHFDYPGGPKDIARQNKIIQDRTKGLKEQKIPAEHYEEKRKADVAGMERRAIAKYRAQVDLAEDQRKFREKEGGKALLAFVEETSVEMALVEEKREASLEINQTHAKGIEEQIIRQLREKSLKVKCKFEGNGSETDEVQCAVITSKTDRTALHELKSIAYTLAVNLRRAYPLSYSIFAQTSDNTPLARFMYNYPFDVLTPLILWH